MRLSQRSKVDLLSKFVHKFFISQEFQAIYFKIETNGKAEEKTNWVKVHRFV